MGEIIIHAASGLHHAHTKTDIRGKSLKIVHRDVSPQNIIVGSDGVARLLDFGIAKATGSASGTREGQVKGKVPYMAPEILNLHPASVASDVYAVAVTLWESLCARRLFRADTEIGLWGQVLAGNIPKPSTYIASRSRRNTVGGGRLSAPCDSRYTVCMITGGNRNTISVHRSSQPSRVGPMKFRNSISNSNTNQIVLITNSPRFALSMRFRSVGV